MKFQLSLKFNKSTIARKEIEAKNDKDLAAKLDRMPSPWNQKERLTIERKL